MPTTIPTIMDQISAEKTKVSERLARLDAVHDARHEAASAGLLLTGIVDLPDTAYRGLLDYEREAGDLGYPALA